MKNTETREIDPARLASGEWCHKTEKTLGQGDIYASYSADRIAMSQPIKKPFQFHGSLWVCVSMRSYHGAFSIEAYRLVHPSQFDGAPTTYTEKTFDGDAARADQSGFYHGMTVKHGGASFVLCGPPLTLIPGQTAQLSLFDCADAA